jgi:DNA-binding response OmpR family regulator
MPATLSKNSETPMSMHLRHVLLVDDDAELRTALAEQLEQYEQLGVEQAGTAAETLRRLETSQFALILLDVGLPDMDGRELCKLIRRSGIKCPIMMLTAYDADADAILGLNCGANDYVTKPFRLPVLLARVRSLLRQYALSDDALFIIGPFDFRPSTRMLVHSGTKRKTPLTEKEAALLKYLCHAHGRPVSMDVLLKEIWNYGDQVHTHTLQTHVYRLRQKMESDPEHAELLLTDEKGYRLAVS